MEVTSEQQPTRMGDRRRQREGVPPRRKAKLNDLLGYSFRTMRERKLRAILTIAMVMMGASLMVALNGLTTGASEYIAGQFETVGANLIIVMAKERPPTEKVASAIGKLPDVVATVPFVTQTATFQSAEASDYILVMGQDQKYMKEVYPSLQVAEGTLLASNDSMGIVLGHSLAYPSNTATPIASVGGIVTLSVSGEQITNRTFVVKGILAEAGAAGVAGAIVPFLSLDRMAFISLPAAVSLFDVSAGEYSGVNVVATGPEKAEQIATAISQTYGSSFEVHTLKSMIGVLQRITGAFSTMTNAIASVSMIVASVGIFAGLYTSVTERTKEIGLLKAIGFKKRGILAVFLGEATLIGIIGGLLGAAFGVALGHGMAYLAGPFASVGLFAGEMQLSYLPPVFTPGNFLFVLAFSVVVSMVAGAYPAWRASRLDPVVALRKE
jgi:putative ABC transport system permease protein